MTFSNATVSLGFNLPVAGTTALILNDPNLGKLDTGQLTDPATNVTPYVTSVAIRRGKSDQIWDVINAGTCEITFKNNDRRFDPNYTPGPYFGQILPGVTVTVAVDNITLFTGRVADWNFDYDVQGVSVATASCVDPLGVLGRQEFDAWTTTAGQLTGARISAVLNRAEVSWNAGARSIDTGNTTLQADNVSWGSNVLNYLQLVNQSELGYFYADRLGVVTFRDRFATYNVASAITFGSNVAFHGINTTFGSETLFNRVGVDPEGLTKQTAVDGTSAAQYGYSSISLSGLMDSEAQASSMASYLLGQYSQPRYRVQGLSVSMHDPRIGIARRADILALDITSVVGVSWTPNRVGSAITETAAVQGIDHDIGPTTHTVTLHLIDASNQQVFTLDDTTFGLLDGAALLGF